MSRSVIRRLLTVAAVVVILVVVDVGATAGRRQIDLTADHSQTLTGETRRIVGGLRRRVRATAFFVRTDPNRVAAPTLLGRYSRLNRRLTYRVLDPEQTPAAAAAAGIDPAAGGIALTDGKRTERADTATEQDITAALARLERARASTVCVATGHGESDPTSTLDDGMASTMKLLSANGYVVRPVDLLTRSEVPAGCDALLLAGPTAPLGPAADGIAAYLSGGGRAVVLTDPASTVDLNPLLSAYGMKIDRGIVVEGDARRRFPDDPTRPIALDYHSSSPIVRRLAPTFYPGAQDVVLGNTGAVPGLAVSAVVSTSDHSYLEHHPDHPGYDEGDDRPGPLVLVGAADLSANLGNHVRRTRLVVAGDVDFATNAFVGQAANGTLLVKAMDWVTLEQSLVTVSANLPRVRPLDLTEGRLRYARFLLAVVVPGLFLLVGAMTLLVQRAR